MKIRISDMMDPWTDLPVPIQEEENASAERIKEVTTRKIQETRKPPAVRRLSRTGLLAAALAAALCVSAGAAAGAVPDFALGRGSMVPLHPEGAEGFSWSAGQSVTLTQPADRDCWLRFGLFRDGSFLGGESVIAQEQAYTFSIPEDGCYLVSAQYFSSDAGAFQAVHLTEE